MGWNGTNVDWDRRWTLVSAEKKFEILNMWVS
jgi:hypothetical protein